MAKQSYAKRMEGELTPVVNGRQYRAREIKVVDECRGCAAKDDTALCNALPECGKWNRLDVRNVVFVDCGPAKAAPAIKTETNGRGGVRFEHEGFNIGTKWIHAPTAERVEVVGEGMAGMPEVKFEDGHTIFVYPQDLKPITKAGAE